MKCLVVLACILVATYAAVPPEFIEKVKNHLHKFGGECKGETGASEDDAAPIMLHELPTTEKGKCFLACLNKKLGFQDASGKIDKEGSYKVIDEIKPIDEELYNKMKKIADTCLAEVTDAADECETAANMMVCVKREKKTAGVDFD